MAKRKTKKSDKWTFINGRFKTSLAQSNPRIKLDSEDNPRDYLNFVQHWYSKRLNSMTEVQIRELLGLKEYKLTSAEVDLLVNIKEANSSTRITKATKEAINIIGK